MPNSLFYVICGVLGFIMMVFIMTSFARFAMAVFSVKRRDRIKRRPILHAAWLCASIAALILTVYPSPERQKIRRARTMNQMSQVGTAIENYETEYGSPPEGTSNAQIIPQLVSNNPRHIAFLSPMAGDINLRGELLDAWGTPFRIMIDQPKRLLIQSAGKDRKFDTADDIDLFQKPDRWEHFTGNKV